MRIGGLLDALSVDVWLKGLTERRSHRPWGLLGGRAGLPGINRLNGHLLAAKLALAVRAGDRLLIDTPGGGGYLAPEP